MARVKDIKDLSRYIQTTKNSVKRSYSETLLRVTQQAEAFAKQNSTKQFVGRNGRRLSGRLLNSIFSGVNPFTTGTGMPTGFVGTRGIPYGRIHEVGGVIVPVKRTWLWIKQWGGAADRFRRMTPRDFVGKLKQKDRDFKILGKKNSKGKIAVYQPRSDTRSMVKLFALAKRVNMPARPYLTPAADKAVKMFGTIARKILNRTLRKGR